MSSNNAVRQETRHIALGVAIGDVIMLAVFLVLKKLDYTVLLGALLGSAAAIGNFAWMCSDVQKAVSDPDRAQLRMRASYTRRMLFMVAVMVLGFVVPWFHPVAVLVPFLFPGIAIKVMQLRKRGDG